MRISDWSSDVCSSDLFTEFLGLQILARGLYGNHMRFGEGCFDQFLHIAASHNGNAGTFPNATQQTAPPQRRRTNHHDPDAPTRPTIPTVPPLPNPHHLPSPHTHPPHPPPPTTPPPP